MVPLVNDIIDAQRYTVYVHTMDSKYVGFIILKTYVQLDTSVVINETPTRLTERNDGLVNSYNAIQLKQWTGLLE